jgi:hypothetical protein
MITADQEGAGFPVRWTTTSWINAKPCFLIAAAVLFPVLIALSLPCSQPSQAIADDPRYVPAYILSVTATDEHVRGSHAHSVSCASASLMNDFSPSS